ncbi:lipase family protein [Frankia sp. Cr2]|uniref:lipase family protein n=1 Tax=Frankia sp. Cr2 TaxID=3073932 RepID=UPI002AD30273|nr:lipase family protein [Frankia sp. Cr2]
MLVRDTKAPSYETLRPFKNPDAPGNLGKFPGFPVYEGLSTYLADAKDHPDDVVRHVLATCAAYVYAKVDPPGPENTDTLATMMARMGLEENNCRIVAESVDAMLISSTAAIVQSSDKRVVILAYRGTEPSNIMTWLTDVEIYAGDATKFRVSNPRTGDSGALDLHAGFYRNVRATRYEVLRALKRAMAGQSILDADIRPGEGDLNGSQHITPTLYITGHSLGGAMAAIMGIMLMTDPQYKYTIGNNLRAVYTFGQPMIGPQALADAYEKIENRAPVLRYVHRKDPVPHLPPRQTGTFAHFGREWHYDGKEWKETSAEPARQMKDVTGLGRAALAFVAEQSPSLRRIPVDFSISDHFPQHYVERLTPPGTLISEFGDDQLILPTGEPAPWPMPSFLRSLPQVVVKATEGIIGNGIRMAGNVGRAVGSTVTRRT